MIESQSEPQARTLGLLRWVQTAFMALGAFLFWLVDRVAVTLWALFDEPDTTATTAGSAVVAALIAWRLYSHEKVNRLAHEVVGELAKVTWPVRREVSAATVVVIITSVIAAVILGTFDAVWSAVTDLIYTV